MSGGFGPRSKTRVPIASSYGDVRILKATVEAVDKVKYTLSVRTENGETADGIAAMPRSLNADGTGSYEVPEVNSTVWICVPSTEGIPFILGHAPIPLQTDEDDGDPNDYRMNRPVLNEGDEMVASKESGYVILRKGGMLEVAATQMCRTFWIPIENLVHTIAENFIVDTTGGSLSLLTRDEDETHGADISPTEFKLNLKEFANDEFDIFDLRIGRIAVEDDTYIPPGGGLAQIILRLMVNRHFLINIDKNGNFLKTLQGSETENIEGSKFSVIHKTFQQTVRGLFSHGGKDRVVTLDGNDNLTVKGVRTQEFGTLSENVLGSAKRFVKGALEETTGEVTSVIQGAKSENIAGPSNETVGGGKALGVGENLDITVGGKFGLSVGNAQFPTEGTGLELILTSGEMHLVDKLGAITLASGGLADAAVARILVKPKGTILLQNALGKVAQIEVNASGIKISTAGGDICIDAKGSVSLGAQIGGGCVVTTLSHPADYMTGAPILGVSTVTAAGIPSVVPVPPTFAPDLT